MKQFAPACERNQTYILEVLREALPVQGKVLEIGSGTGQHAACFAAGLPDLQWQPTDRTESLASIAAWRAEANAPNLLAPILLDLGQQDWPVEYTDAVVCINTIHIVKWQLVAKLFRGAARILPVGGILFLYGPFRYRNRSLEPSNVSFDEWLKARDPESGIRLFEDVHALAVENGFSLVNDVTMPANNRSIWWQKV